eukprot:892412-Rhodomonas_salina.1
MSGTETAYGGQLHAGGRNRRQDSRKRGGGITLRASYAMSGRGEGDVDRGAPPGRTLPYPPTRIILRVLPYHPTRISLLYQPTCIILRVYHPTRLFPFRRPYQPTISAGEWACRVTSHVTSHVLFARRSACVSSRPTVGGSVVGEADGTRIT